VPGLGQAGELGVGDVGELGQYAEDLRQVGVIVERDDLCGALASHGTSPFDALAT